MNGELKKRAAAIIGGSKSTVSERLDLLLGMVLDIHERTESHDVRLSALEAYPLTVSRVFKAFLGAAALVAAAGGLWALLG